MDDRNDLHNGTSFKMGQTEGRLLRIGTNINIKRTDGRVHSAFVAGINFDLKSATVEWIEEGETKGKEIDMASIEVLNPDVITSRPSEVYPSHKPIQKSTSNLHRIPTRATLTSRSSIKTSRPPNRGAHFSHNDLSNTDIQRTKTNCPSVSSSSTDTTRSLRRSNVVREVEKLKKSREERRQKQAEEKAEKEAFLQLAPGNPHWELLKMIKEYRSGLNIQPLTVYDTIEDHLITVCVRKRPLNKYELGRKEVDVITVPSKNQLIVHEPKNKVDLTKYLENQLFRFDYAFDENATNDLVYKYSAQPLVKTIFEGGFSTCFAYGQTGSGKTHTMGGNFNGKVQDSHKGIYAMAAGDVFRLASSPRYKHYNLLISCSYFEIYSGKVFDLLAKKKKLRILEDGKQQVQVVGLTEQQVVCVSDVLKLIQKGNLERTSGQTAANPNSSRSHAIFQITLRQRDTIQRVHGKFSLVDLAGNERGADTSSADRQTRMEGAEINKSLLALKECIRALGRKKAHLPFRVSRLTHVLRDSFVGPNSRTCMIAMISPGVFSCEHSLNTLRYADRVKELVAGDVHSYQGDDDNDNDKQDQTDLLQLRSLNEQDMTTDMLNFHRMVSELQLAEDNMLDNQKQTIELLSEITEEAKRLLQMADNVDYDQDEYCNSWDELLRDAIDELVTARAVVADFKGKLADEEQLSRKTKGKATLN